MYVMLLNYVEPTQKIDELLEAHREFLDRYFASGKFICAGRQIPRTGGVILCNATSREEAEAISKEDPFVREKAAEYTIIEFVATKFATGFDKFIS